MGRLGGSTTPWKCKWEHKFSQSSEWVDLVVVRHHGSVHRDEMDGRVCEDMGVSGSTRIGVGV